MRDRGAIQLGLQQSTSSRRRSISREYERSAERPTRIGGSPDADTATSTTPSALEPSAANDNEPLAEDADKRTEPETEQVAIQETVREEATVTDLEAANDNPPPIELPATGTE